MLDRALPLLVLLFLGCELEHGALGSPDAGAFEDAGRSGDGPADDGSDRPRDAGPAADAGARPRDAGLEPPCLPVDELCNGRDDDCDGTVDDGVCSGCLVEDIAGTVHVFCVEPRPWAEARSWCLDQGLDLTIVDDLDEDRRTHGQARVLRARGWWIGLEDRAVEGTYRWVDGRIAWQDGTARTFTNFHDGRPDDRPPDDCVHLDGSLPAGAWVESRCDALAPFVCEAPREEGRGDDDDPPEPEP